MSEVDEKNVLKWRGAAERLRQNDPSFVEVDLSYGSTNAALVQELADALKTNTVSTSFTCYWGNLYDEGAELIADALKSNTSVQNLSLGNNKIGEIALKAIGSMLKENATLKYLRISQDTFPLAGVQALSEGLRHNATLETIELASLIFDASGVQPLSDAIARNTGLLTIDFTDCNIGDEAASLFIEAFKTNTTCTNIAVGGNSIGLVSARALAQVLLVNRTLKDIDLTGSKLGPDSGPFLGEALKHSITLQSLKLGHNKLGIAGVQALAAGLAVNTSLVELELAKNNVCNEGLVALAEAIKKHTTIATLGLKSNHITGDGVLALVEAIKINNSLTKIDLEDNSFGRVSWDLDKALRRAGRAKPGAPPREQGASAAPVPTPTPSTPAPAAAPPRPTPVTSGPTPGPAASASAAAASNQSQAVPKESTSQSLSDKRRTEIQALLAAAISPTRDSSNPFTTPTPAVTQPFMRSKMMFVGRGRAGKTCTVNALLGRPFSQSEASTIGCTSTETSARLDNVEAAAWQVVKQDRELQRVVVAHLRKDRTKSNTQPLDQDAALKRIAKSVATTPSSSIGARGSAASSSAQGTASTGPSSRAPLAAISMSSAPAPAQDSMPAPTPTPTPIAAATATTPGTDQSPSQPAAAPTPTGSNDNDEEDARALLLDRMTKLVDETTLGVLGELDGLNASPGSSANAIRFSIWDLAGQTVFYDLLHILLTRYAIYVVCFDMEEMLGADAARRADCLAYIKFWLTSVHLHAGGARVCLVGTHKDRVPERRKHEEISKLLMSGLTTHPTLKDLIFNSKDELAFFPINNTQAAQDPTVAHLRVALEQAARDQDHVAFQIPTPWLACLDAVRGLARERQLQRMALTTVTQFASKSGITSTQLPMMMKVFHEFGLWMHFGEDPALHGTVVLDPQWIIDSFASIIRDFSLHTKASDRKVLQHAREFDELSRKARLHAHLVPLLWSEHSESERAMLLKLMMDFGMLLPLRQTSTASSKGPSSSSHDTQGFQTYLVAALLPVALSDDAFGAAGTRDVRLESDHDSLTDAMSTKFTRHMLRYAGRSSDLAPGWCEWYLAFFSEDAVTVVEHGQVTVADLERSGLLPYGLFGRLILTLLHHQQLTNTHHSSELSRTSGKVYLGMVETHLDLMDHVSCIRVRAHTQTALPIVRRIEEAINSLLSRFFPQVKSMSLLPYSPTLLLTLESVQSVFASRSVLHLQRETINTERLLSLYEAFVAVRGLREVYHVMISYRQAANSEFVAKLHDTLCQTVLHQSRQQLAVFYDQLSLQRGSEFDVDFCTGISRSLVAVPVLSVQAMQRMTDEAFVTHPDKVDNVLLEWMTMMVLKTHGRLQRIVPVVLGEAWPNTQATTSQTTLLGINDFGKLNQWIANTLPNSAAVGTVTRLKEILPQLGLNPLQACEGLPLSPRGVVTALMRFDAIVRFDAARPTLPTHTTGSLPTALDASLLASWSLFEGIAEEVRVLVDELARVESEARQGAARAAVSISVAPPASTPAAATAAAAAAAAATAPVPVATVGAVTRATSLQSLCTGPYAVLLDYFPAEFTIEDILSSTEDQMVADVDTKHRVVMRTFWRKFVVPLGPG